MIMQPAAIRQDPTHALVMMDILVMGGHATTLMSVTPAMVVMQMQTVAIQLDLMNVIVMTCTLEMAGTAQVDSVLYKKICCFNLSSLFQYYNHNHLEHSFINNITDYLEQYYFAFHCLFNSRLLTTLAGPCGQVFQRT